jgi:hypothetical protein
MDRCPGRPDGACRSEPSAIEKRAGSSRRGPRRRRSHRRPPCCGLSSRPGPC